MVAHAKPPYITPEQYLLQEEAAETKSEYYDGVIVAMSGASLEHNRVMVNISGWLFPQLRGKFCEPFVADMRVSVPASNRYYYPDVSVACGEPELEIIAGVPSLLNPAVIVEVLSPSTAGTDRGEKLICYQTIPSLATYVIVSQERPLIQCYERQSDGSWNYRLYEGLEATIPLPAIDCALRLADVYARIEFPQPGQDKEVLPE